MNSVASTNVTLAGELAARCAPRICAASLRCRPIRWCGSRAACSSLDRQFGLVFVGIGDGGEGRREDHLADAAVGLRRRRRACGARRGAHVDHGHQVGGREDHAARIAVAQRRVGEPADIAAEPVVVLLHDQRVDLALGHELARRRPAALELGGRDRIEQPFVHDASLPRGVRIATGRLVRQPEQRRGVRRRRSGPSARPDSAAVSRTNSTGFISPTG